MLLERKSGLSLSLLLGAVTVVLVEDVESKGVEEGSGGDAGDGRGVLGEEEKGLVRGVVPLE